MDHGGDIMSDAAILKRPDSEPSRSAPTPRGWIGQQFAQVRARLLSGLLVAAPVVITCWIVYWLFVTLGRFLLDPITRLAEAVAYGLRQSPALKEAHFPDWWYTIASPILAIALVLIVLYLLGLAVRSWIYRTIDGLFLKAPIVASIYRAVRNLVDSLGDRLKGKTEAKRVVLVEFPHKGVRSLGLATNSVRDEASGRTILTVCVLTGVMPPTGFTFFVAEEDVIDLPWTVNDAIQTIMSGGISAPGSIRFDVASSRSTAAGGEAG